MKTFTLLLVPIFICVSCQSKKIIPTTTSSGAALIGDLPENPFLFEPISFFIDNKNETLNVIYGNSKAVDQSTLDDLKNYKPGSIIYVVSWKRKSDRVWFGAKIPDSLMTVERVAIMDSNKIRYQFFSNMDLPKIKSDSAFRVKQILNYKSAKSPAHQQITP